MSPQVETLRAEARLRNIFDATPVPLMLLDADDAIHFVNPAFTLPGRVDVSAAEGVTLEVTFTPSPPEPRGEPRTRSKGMLLA